MYAPSRIRSALRNAEKYTFWSSTLEGREWPSIRNSLAIHYQFRNFRNKEARMNQLPRPLFKTYRRSERVE